MKNIKLSFMALAITIGLLVSSCEKEEVLIESASITVVNGLENGDDLQLRFQNNKSNYGPIRQSYFNDYGFGSNGIQVYGVSYDQPTGLSAVAVSDTLKPIYDEQLDLEKGTSYSICFMGSPEHPDHLIIKDKVFPIRDVKTMNVRFLNLVPNVNSVSINLAGKDLGSEKSSLIYKSITEFKSYNIDRNAPLIFEFRNTSDGELLGSYEYNPAWNPIRGYANITFILRGIKDADPGIQLIKFMNN